MHSHNTQQYNHNTNLIHAALACVPVCFPMNQNLYEEALTFTGNFGLGEGLRSSVLVPCVLRLPLDLDPRPGETSPPSPRLR